MYAVEALAHMDMLCLDKTGQADVNGGDFPTKQYLRQGFTS